MAHEINPIPDNTPEEALAETVAAFARIAQEAPEAPVHPWQAQVNAVHGIVPTPDEVECNDPQCDQHDDDRYEVAPDPEYRCPECDTYSGTFTQDGDEVVHSTCGRAGTVASFTRGTPEFDAVYDHQEDGDPWIDPYTGEPEFAGEDIDLSDPEPSNEARADWARVALGTFRTVTGADDEDDIESSLTDLITDLLHLARDEEGLDADDILERAHLHFSHEVNEEEMARIARLGKEDRP
jgi:hypothetical protein